MKYVRPQELNENKIDEILSDENEIFENKVSALISTVYYSEDNSIILNRLLSEFKKSNNYEKESLLALFETYYDMRRTTFNIDESIKLIKEFLKENPGRKDIIDDCLSNLRHCKKVYS